jgi:hypothetical protein
MSLNEAFSRFCVGKILSDKFYIRYGPKLGDALLPLLLKFALVCVLRKSKRIRKDWKMELISSYYIVTMLIFWMKI